MERKDYNGWTNYETWNVALWLDNEQGMQEHFNERAADYVEEHDDQVAAAHIFAAEIKDYHEDAVAEGAEFQA